MATALASPPPVTRVTSMTDPPVDIWIIDEMQSVCRREDDCDRFGPLIRVRSAPRLVTQKCSRTHRRSG
jgi:hypothetical protein